MKAVYAVVDTVKPVPSRNVSIIQLEVPMEDHVAITELLFGKTALVVPMSLDGVRRYGVQDTDNPIAEPREKRGKPIASLLGRWCKSASFWEWLNTQEWSTPVRPVDDEHCAVLLMHDVLDVSSRAEIDGDPRAEHDFHELIRRPYMDWSEGRMP